MVDNYLDGIESVGLWKSDYVIHCNGRKWASVLGVQYGYHGGFCGVRVDFVSLADGASFDKLLYESLHFRPDVVASNEFKGLVLSRVSREYMVVFELKYAYSKGFIVRYVNTFVE